MTPTNVWELQLLPSSKLAYVGYGWFERWMAALVKEVVKTIPLCVNDYRLLLRHLVMDNQALMEAHGKATCLR